MDVLTVIAILLSPLVAVLVSRSIEDWKDLKKQKTFVFLSLVSSRHQNITEEQARIFNSIDVVFSKNPNVREKWKEYFELLGQPDRMSEWAKKKLELLKVMADEVGYKKAIDHLDLDRVYYPTGLTEDAEKRKIYEEKILEFIKRVEVVGVSSRNDS